MVGYPHAMRMRLVIASLAVFGLALVVFVYVLSGRGNGSQQASSTTTPSTTGASTGGSQEAPAEVPDDYANVMIVPAAGGKVRALTHVHDEEAFFESPSFGRSSSLIAATRVDCEGCSGAVIIMRTDGTHQRVVVADRNVTRVAWSPDGSMVAFSADGQIFVKSLRSGRTVRVTSGVPHDKPAWMPDSRSLVVVRQTTPANSDLVRLSAQGGPETPLVSDARPELDPAVSPDGKLVAYTRQGVDGVWRLWLIGIDGSHPRVIPIAGRASDENPSFSPDGTRLAYTSVLPFGNLRIGIVTLDGTHQRFLTKGMFEASQPSFSRSGKLIAFAAHPLPH